MPYPRANNPAAAIHNGTTFFRLGLYKGAIEHLAHGLTLDPESIRGRYYLALAHFRLEADFFAIPEYNRILSSPDSEAALAAKLLRRAFLLRDGDPLTDVTRLSQADACRVITMLAETPLEPIRFARLIWSCKWGSDTTEHVDLSIVHGPEARFYCTMPPEQSPLIIEPDPAWIPVWSCPTNVFDRMAAMQLFFMRALLYWRYGCHFVERPIYSFSGILPRGIREMLIDRVYNGYNTTVEDEQGWLFPDLPWVPDDFDEEW
jgi:hypothetical protein